MNQTLKQSKQAIRAFVRAHWSDQKLTEVYAFNRDGKMHWNDYCGCLLGVSLAETLHTRQSKCPDLILGMHYISVKKSLRNAAMVEAAYWHLWDGSYIRGFLCWDALAQRRLSAILRAEMRRREHIRVMIIAAESPVGELVAQ